jgi:endonuclease I
VLYQDGGNGNIAVDVRGSGTYQDTYYDPSQGQSDEALKLALRNLINGHNSLGYSDARDEMYMVIDNQKVNGQGAANNRVETIYVGDIAEGYSSRIDAQDNYDLNTEHTFPQSQFSSSEPMLSDLFHLFITDASVNGARGNKPFGNVTNPTWQQGGSRMDDNRFEPRDQQKGQTARAVLYFLIRYGNSGNFVDATQQNTLLQWHEQFPPGSIELQRNEDVFEVQDNRNPFIDHPDLSDRIGSFISISESPIVRRIFVTDDTIDFGTVPSGYPSPYELILINTGNQDIDLTNISTTSSDIFIQIPEAPIAPGESGIIRLIFTPDDLGLLNHTLTFSNSSTNTPNVELPIVASAVATGLDEMEIDFQIKIYPNPVANELTIDFEDVFKGELYIYNASGEAVRSYGVDYLSQLKVDFSSFPQGIYTFAAYGKEHNYFKNFIKFFD